MAYEWDMGFTAYFLLDIAIRYSNRVMQNPPWMILPLKHIKASVDQGFSSRLDARGYLI